MHRLFSFVSVTLVALAALAVACGGHTVDQPTQDPSSGSSNPSDSGSSGSSTAPFTTMTGAAGGMQAGPDGAPPPDAVCSAVGDRRNATPSEMAQYCVCEKDLTYLLWRCYGPSPSAPSPQASCTETLVNPGSQGSCLVDWHMCSDGKTYALSCTGGAECYCLIDSRIAVTVPPMDMCPESKPELNKLCGWQLN